MKLRSGLGSLIIAWSWMLLATTASAQDAPADQVVLRLKGGNVEIAGTLRSFDGTSYVVTSRQLGTIALFAERFDCTGAACGRLAPPLPKVEPQPRVPAIAATTAVPANAPLAPHITVHAPDSVGPLLLADLVKGWIESTGGKTTRELGAATGETRLRAMAPNGTEALVVSIRRGPAAAALAGLRSNTADIAVTDRRIDDKEAAALAPIAGNMRSAARELVIGLDAFAVVVSPDNPLRSLSIANIGRIFAGQVTNWADLGQPGGPIEILTTPTTTGPGSVFESRILKPQSRSLAATSVALASSEAVAEAVAQRRGAIGVTAFADMRNAKPLSIEQSCGLVTEASTFAIKTEEYPLSRRIYLYTARDLSNGPARGLLGFIASAKGQDIVTDHLLVSQTLDTLAFDDHAARTAHAAAKTVRGQEAQLRRFIADTGGAHRLTMTVRFDSGTSRIDSKSQNDLAGLMPWLRQSLDQRKKVMLLGFSDAVGAADKNLALAVKRATQARGALVAAAGGRIDPALLVAVGHGALAPVACDDEESGRQLNRRVEIWVRDAIAPVAAAPAPPARRAP